MRAPEIAREALGRLMLCTLYSYGGVLALGLVGLIGYNIWNHRKMKKQREAQCGFFAELYEADKSRGSMLSRQDSFYKQPVGQTVPIPSVPKSVGPGLGMSGRQRTSGNTMSVLEGESDTIDEDYGRQRGAYPSTLHRPYGETGRRRSPSLESRESWEA